MTRQRQMFICGPTQCPNDDDFEHDPYYKCVPKDFNGNTGRSKTYKQSKRDDRYHWNGGCCAVGKCK